VKPWWRQWCSRRAVSGVTCHWLRGSARQASTWPRTSLMIEVGVVGSVSNPFFDKPILNSPYEYPRRHWELDDQGQPTQKTIETRQREPRNPLRKPGTPAYHPAGA
jgi:hypothetical protein